MVILLLLPDSAGLGEDVEELHDLGEVDVGILSLVVRTISGKTAHKAGEGS